ncbi:hypothetical protein D3C87_1915860 [compost metagenome]
MSVLDKRDSFAAVVSIGTNGYQVIAWLVRLRARRVPDAVVVPDGRLMADLQNGSLTCNALLFHVSSRTLGVQSLLMKARAIGESTKPEARFHHPSISAEVRTVH